MARRTIRAACAAALLLAAASVQDPVPAAPLGPGPRWRGPVRPAATNEVFATADGCAMCHSAAPAANAMRGPTGEDVSPHGLWQATVMAQSFRDPYWRAQVAKERSLDPEHADEVDALCMRCHAPMRHHTRRLGGLEPGTVAAAADDPLAQDGVSCTVCHQIQPDQLGAETSFAGKARIEKGRVVFGPYADPQATPMRMMAGYQAAHGAHVSSSALCATCHTLHTSHQGPRFPEQTPYLEWRNSEFSDEGERAGSATARTCQQCHMADVGPTRIARNPGGGDFLIPLRDPYRAHAFVGGNAFLLDLLAANRDELAVPASAEALRRTARATRRLLTTQTVALEIGELTREGSALRGQIRVQNLTGHKFPTGYPSRRAWLHVQVRVGQQVVFESGAFTSDGRLSGVESELQPHVTRIAAPDDVLVWELVALDRDGRSTTSLVQMAERGKDNRLLPRGYRPDGPHVEDTVPVGVGSDLDFTAGGDTVELDVPLAEGAGSATVVAWVHYQTIPPRWVDALRAVDADECRAFVRMYDAADREPETIAAAVRQEQAR